MTPRELRLRKRIDLLTSERDKARGALEQAKTDAKRLRSQLNRRKRCAYCGYPTRGIACPSHADLVGIDPFYNQRHRSVDSPTQVAA